MRSRFAFAFALTLGSAGSLAQAVDPVTQFRTQLIGNGFVLRDYAGPPNLDYKYDGSSLTSKDLKFREYALVVPAKVEVARTEVTIQGDRVFVVRNKVSGKLTPTTARTPWKARIKTTQDIDLLKDLTNIRALLFFTTLAESIAGVPKALATNVPAVYDPDLKKFVTPPSKASEPGETGVEKIGDDVKAPILRQQVDPDFPGGKIDDATVLVGFEIDEQGKPFDFWVLRSWRADFDESAVNAVRQYRFQPAMKNGVPVRVRLVIEVSWSRLR